MYTTSFSTNISSVVVEGLIFLSSCVWLGCLSHVDVCDQVGFTVILSWLMTGSDDIVPVIYGNACGDSAL